ncbi:male-enhanced antigen 1-like isoform X1 [Mytilus trossulus]|uniref:male-enhanced antigen 1-like isoform X1 n=1 Tax=Mytilus trossulus TaxID=6551 RepID=UPI0030053D64
MAPVPEEGEHNAKPADTEVLDDIPVPDVFIDAINSDSEDDDSEDGFGGYQMLPQDIEEDEGSVDGDSHDEVSISQIDEAMRNSGVHVQAGGGAPSYMQVPELPKSDPQTLLWNQNGEEDRIQFDEENAEKIKTVMKKIQLPLCNIPDWAKDIPDDQWKDKIAKMQDKKS